MRTIVIKIDGRESVMIKWDPLEPLPVLLITSTLELVIVA